MRSKSGDKLRAEETLVSMRMMSLFMVDALVISILEMPCMVLISSTKADIICFITRNIKKAIIKPLAMGKPNLAIRSKASTINLRL